MYENENDVNSGVEPEVSQEPQSQPEHQETAAQDASAQQSVSKPADSPFHEHPRFKELVEQKNQYAKETEALKSRLQEFERRFTESQRPAPQPKPANPMIERLKGIDPEFATYMESLSSEIEHAKSVKSELENLKQEKFIESVNSKVNGLKSELKVSDADQNRYQDLIDYSYMTGRVKTVQEIEKLYRDLHAQDAQRYSELQKQATDTYLAQKKADVKAPTATPKGQAPKPTQASKYTGDKYKDRQAMLKTILKQDSADSDF